MYNLMGTVTATFYSVSSTSVYPTDAVGTSLLDVVRCSQNCI
uniref:Uncharacterized protein n=1 Tax=Anguilla anguilla TaxID=7936 RepID=A0A0E9S6A4_ANGAN